MSGSPSFTTKQIDLTFQLGKGNFGAAGQNLLKVSGLRILAQLSAILNQGGTRGATQIILRIYGLTPSVMNSLTVAGLGFGVRQNYVMVEAGDVNGTSMVFRGLIIDAFPELNQMPDSAFMISATTAQDTALKPVAPNSFKGTADVAQIMNSLATAAGLAFENNGVDVKLSNPYLHGTLMMQMELVGKAANINWHIDGTTNNGTLAIWPKNGSRGGGIPVISPASGLIGYPSFEHSTIIIRTVFNPLIKQGGQIQIPQSETITAARGNWNVIQIDASLSSQVPDGPWEMEVKAVSTSQ
jgi:hypothetical protein